MTKQFNGLKFNTKNKFRKLNNRNN